MFLPLLITIFLGGVFSYFQLFEYKNSPFSIRDRAYGTTFFVSTGFHGIHVIVGTLFLFICLFREIKNHFAYNHHVGLEFSI
jgi:heme/copper-type cytochrome/quinol oxidase subunit 3